MEACTEITSGDCRSEDRCNSFVINKSASYCFLICFVVSAAMIFPPTNRNQLPEPSQTLFFNFDSILQVSSHRVTGVVLLEVCFFELIFAEVPVFWNPAACITCKLSSTSPIISVPLVAVAHLSHCSRAECTWSWQRDEGGSGRTRRWKEMGSKHQRRLNVVSLYIRPNGQALLWNGPQHAVQGCTLH